MTKLESLINELCPNGVEYKELKDIFIQFNGMTGVSNKWADEGNCKFIDYLNAYNNLKIDVNRLENATVKKTSQNVLKQNDILLTCASETPDECAISSVIENEIVENVFLDDHLFGIRAKDEFTSQINSTFINYYMHTLQHRKEVNKTVRGVTRFYIANDAFMKIMIPVPPRPVQDEIVRILDKMTDLTIELTKTLATELDGRKKQYEYYRDKLLSDEKTVRYVNLDDICFFYNGDRGKNYPSTSEMVNEGVPFVNAGDLNNGYVDLINCNKITEEKYNSLNGAKLRKNDILYCLRGSTGKNAIYTADYGTVASSLVVLRVKDGVNYKYVYYLLNSSFEIKQRYRSDSGAAQPNLSAANVKKYRFPLPPLEEQERIVSILDNFDKYCHDLSEGLPLEISQRQKQYEYYRDKLLTFKRAN